MEKNNNSDGAENWSDRLWKDVEKIRKQLDAARLDEANARESLTKAKNKIDRLVGRLHRLLAQLEVLDKGNKTDDMDDADDIE